MPDECPIPTALSTKNANIAAMLGDPFVSGHHEPATYGHFRSGHLVFVS